MGPGRARIATKEGGFGDIPSREGFHANRQALIEGPTFQARAGGITLGASGMGLADSAGSDFGAMASLMALSPVAITARDPLGQSAIGSAFQSAWGDTDTQWQADRDLSPEDRGMGRASFSDRWIADRAALLDTRVRANVANEEQFVTDRALRDACAYEERQVANQPSRSRAA